MPTEARPGDTPSATAADDDRLAQVDVETTVNGRQYAARCDQRRSLAEFLREDCGLTGTHIGCEQGFCGACTVLLDGEPVRSCLMLAVQARDADILTVEGVGEVDGRLHPLQEAFRDQHSFQCGFCTPGFVMTALAFLRENPDPTDEEITVALAGNLCRCTGYESIQRGVRCARDRMRR